MASTSTLLPALAAGLALSWGVSSCGSGGSGTVAQSVKSAAADAPASATGTTEKQPVTTATTTKTQTVTQPAKTVTAPTATVTAPAKTVTTAPKTVTEAQTVTNEESHSAAKVAVIAPGSTTGDGESDSSGVPWWGWVLIVGGAAGAGIGGYALWRRHHPPAPTTPKGPVA